MANIDNIVESVVIDNLKNTAGASAAAQAVIYQDQAASRNRLNIMAESLLASACKRIQDLDIKEAVSSAALQRGGADSSIPSLLAYLNAGAIGTKSMALTPPETGVSRAFGDLAALASLIDALKPKA
jgi:hypothetical protein